MDKKKVEKIVRLIQTADVLVIGDSPLLHGVTTYDVLGKEHNEVVFANWHDDLGVEYQIHFQECGLAEAEIKGNIISARDELGDTTDIQLFNLTPVILE